MGILHPASEHSYNAKTPKAVSYRRGLPSAQEADSTLARISCQRLGRFLASRTFLRRRMDFGVTSTNSSSEINSMAFSRVHSRGGTRRMASSALDERMFVCFFSLVMLTF